MEYIVKKYTKGLYIGESEENAIALLDYYLSPSNIIIATHTFVNNDYRGQGLANLLFKKLLEVADEKKAKINPLCSYVAQMLNRPEFNIYLAKK